MVGRGIGADSIQMEYCDQNDGACQINLSDIPPDLPIPAKMKN